MANKADCGLLFSRAFEMLSQKTIQDLSDGFDGFTGDKAAAIRYAEDTLGHIERSFKQYTKDINKGGLTQERIDKLKATTDRALVDLSDSISKADGRAKDFTERVEAAKNVDEMKGVAVSIFEEGRALAEAEEKMLANAFDNILDNLHKQSQNVRANAKSAKKAQEAALSSIIDDNDAVLDNFLKKEYGLTGEKLAYTKAAAFMEGKSDIPELDALARGLKSLRDGYSFPRIKDKAPYIGELDGHLFSHKTSRGKLGEAGREGFIDDMNARLIGDNRKRFIGKEKFTEEEFKEALGRYYDNNTEDAGFRPDGKYRSTGNLYGSRVFHFDSLQEQLDYLRKWTDFRDDNMVNSIYKHQKRLLKETARRNFFGPDFEFTMANLKRTANNLMKGKKGDIQAFKNAVDDLSKGDILMHKQLSSGEELAYAWSNAARNIISGTRTGFSFIRDILIDKGFIQGSNAAMVSGKSFFLEWAKAQVRLFKYMGSDQKKIARHIESDGYSMILNIRMQNAGLEQELINQAGKGGWLAKKVEKGSRAFADRISKVTLAERANDGSRMAAFDRVTTLVEDIRGMDFDAVGQEMQAMFKSHNITRDMWELIRKMPKAIDWSGRERGISLKSFDNLTADQVKPFKRPAETIKQARERLKNNWFNFMSTNTDILAARVSQRGQLAPQTGHALIDVSVGGLTQFKNIASSQYMNQVKAANAASGISPDFVTHKLALTPGKVIMASPKFAGRWLLGNVMSGYMFLATKDMLEGKTPRALTPQVIYEAILETSGFGILGMVLTNMYYAGDWMASTHSSVIKPTKRFAEAVAKAEGDPEKLKKAALKFAEGRSPTTNMWFYRFATRLILRALADEARFTDYEIRMMKERGQKPLGEEDLDDAADRWLDKTFEGWGLD